MTPEQETQEHEREQKQPVDGVRPAGGPASTGHVAGSGTPGTEPAEPDAADEVEHDLDELLARAGKADEYLALAQRTQADFENFRKRMARDVAAAETRGVSRLARELLPALDNLGRALAAAEATADEQPEHHLASGIRLVHDELLAALHRVGIAPFDPTGERFDPNEHEAMAQQPFEGAEPGTVVEVYQQGFRHDGAVLRPARVVVAQ
jgi:molecular chaperone GrpE